MSKENTTPSDQMLIGHQRFQYTPDRNSPHFIALEVFNNLLKRMWQGGELFSYSFDGTEWELKTVRFSSVSDVISYGTYEDVILVSTSGEEASFRSSIRLYGTGFRLKKAQAKEEVRNQIYELSQQCDGIRDSLSRLEKDHDKKLKAFSKLKLA